jgi:nitroreductase
LVPEWEEIAATAMAVQNMYLTCTANNVGCYWSSPGMINYLGEFLNLKKTKNAMVFYLGKFKFIPTLKIFEKNFYIFADLKY